MLQQDQKGWGNDVVLASVGDRHAKRCNEASLLRHVSAARSGSVQTCNQLNVDMARHIHGQALLVASPTCLPIAILALAASSRDPTPNGLRARDSFFWSRERAETGLDQERR